MVAEPDSALTFKDLVIAVARKLGTAHYGSDGTEKPQKPTDAHDLDQAQQAVNEGIRMFLHDGPPAHGWRFLRPVGSVVLWADVAEEDGKTVSGGTHDSTNDETKLTATEDVFYESMERRTISTASSGDFTMKRYVSATEMYVEGDASGVSAEKFSVTSNAAYTLPSDFGGSFDGEITFAAGTNLGGGPQWVNESEIRAYRANAADSGGTPTAVAIRPMEGERRRRWEIVSDFVPDQDITIEFPYQRHFDELTADSDTPPVPHTHDEAIKAACLAAAERLIDDELGIHTQYYQQALAKSHAADARSGPKQLQRRPRMTQDNFRDLRPRPDVTFTP